MKTKKKMNTKPFFTANSWGWKLYHLNDQRKRLGK